MIVDTGPLVAVLNGRDAHHAWAVAELAAIPAPLLTCEAVLAEACHLCGPRGAPTVLELVRRGAVAPAFRLEEQLPTVERLMRRYANVPMALADACLVRMAEIVPDAVVWTLDADFRVYRKNGRAVIPTIMPRR